MNKQTFDKSPVLWTGQILFLVCVCGLFSKGGWLATQSTPLDPPLLREVSNFRDSGEIHTHARENGLPRGDESRPRGSPSSRARVFRWNRQRLLSFYFIRIYFLRISRLKFAKF